MNIVETARRHYQRSVSRLTFPADDFDDLIRVGDETGVRPEPVHFPDERFKSNYSLLIKGKEIPLYLKVEAKQVDQ